MTANRKTSSDFSSQRMPFLAFACVLLLSLALVASAKWPERHSPSWQKLLSHQFVKADHHMPDAAVAVMAANKAIADNPKLAIAAPRFSLAAAGADHIAMSSAIDCMTAAIYFEAVNEPIEGQRAVAQVVINRVRHPAYPNSVCGVVFEGSHRATGCQFTFTCDGSLARRPSDKGWLLARSVAASALAGYVESRVGHATHYHASYVLPRWAANLTKLTTIGAHIFYQWEGRWSDPSAFNQKYSPAEEMPVGARGVLKSLLLSSFSYKDSEVMLTDQPREQSPQIQTYSESNRSYFVRNREISAAETPQELNLVLPKSTLIEKRTRLKEALVPQLLDGRPSLSD